MKKLLIRIFNKLGYQVRFRITKLKNYQVDSNEIASLDADLKKYASEIGENKVLQNDKEIDWSDIKVIRGYLDNSRITLFHKVIELLGKHNIDPSGKKVLDLGSGTGYLLRLIGEEFDNTKIVGYDTYAEFNKVAAYICPDMKLHEKDLFSDYDSKYDLIFCTETLEHVIHPGDAINNMKKNLNEGGAIILTVPDGRVDTYGSHGMYPNKKGYWGHINFWSLESWDIFLKKNFENMKVTTGHVGDFNVIYGVIQ